MSVCVAAPVRAPAISLEPVAGGVRVSWEALSDEDARGVVQFYTVYVRQKGAASDPTVVVVNGTTTHCDVTGLTPGMQYEVRVLANTSVPYSAPGPFPVTQWPWLAVTTLAVSVDNLTPLVLELVAVDTTTLRLAWLYRPATPDTTVRAFDVWATSLPTGIPVTRQTLPPTARSHVIQGLGKSHVPDWLHSSVHFSCIKNNGYIICDLSAVEKKALFSCFVIYS